MHRKSLRIAVICLIAALALAACGHDAGEGKAIAHAVDAMPVRLDPAVAESPSELLAVNNVFEGLVRQVTDEGGGARIVPGAAESWDISPDGKVYTFRLRRNTHWRLHGRAADVLGKEARDAFNTFVTADDFVFGLRRAIDPATKAVGAATLYPIANAREIHAGSLPPERLGVKAVDAFTLEITLTRPNAMFLYALTQSAAMPCNQEYFEAAKGRYGLESKYILCNGPFYIYRMDATTRLRRNESYAGEWRVSPAAVDLRAIAEPAERLRRLGAENGVDTAIVPEAMAANRPESSVLLQNGTVSLLFNCASPSLSDVKLRVAMCAALDPEALGLARPLPGLLPENVRMGRQRLADLAPPQPGIAHDPERARNLVLELKEAAEPLRLICAPAHERIMRRALQQWQSLFGLRLRAGIEPLEPEELQERLRRGEYDVAIAELRSSSSFALQAMQDHAGAGNPMRYASDTLQEILRGAAQQQESAEAARAIRQAEAHMLQNGAAYPLMPAASRLLLANGVEGLDVSPAGDQIFFGRARKVG